MTGFLESEEALHAAARDACGLEDFGDDAYLEGLRALLESLDGDAALNPVGELTLRGSIVEALEGRLFSEHGWALHPECADAPIEQPLVIVGLPRTGTSALHQLLSQDPALQGLAYWLSTTPKARPPREAWPDDPQFRACDERLRLVYERSPDMKAIHPVVRIHPETGGRSLLVNEHFTRRLVELRHEESQVLLAHLCAGSTQERFTVRYRWSPGTVAIWDNRCTQHFVLHDFEGERIIRRVTILGDEPEGDETRWEPHVSDRLGAASIHDLALTHHLRSLAEDPAD